MDLRHRRPQALPKTPPGARLGREVLWGTVLVLVGGAFSLLVPTASLTCEREASAPPSCMLQDRIFLDLVPGRSVRIEGLEGVHRRELDRSTPGERTRSNHQLFLRTGSESIRMNLLGEAEAVERVSGEIEDFLDGGEAAELVTVLEPTGVFRGMRWAGTGIVLFGLSYFLAVPLRLYQILRRRQTLSP